MQIPLPVVFVCKGLTVVFWSQFAVARPPSYAFMSHVNWAERLRKVLQVSTVLCCSGSGQFAAINTTPQISVPLFHKSTLVAG